MVLVSVDELFLEVDRKDEAPAVRPWQVLPILWWFPGESGVSAEGFAKLIADEGQSVADSIALIVKGSRTEIVFGRTEQQFNFFGIF